jgi:hypothetical protein
VAASAASDTKPHSVARRLPTTVRRNRTDMAVEEKGSCERRAPSRPTRSDRVALHAMCRPAFVRW